MGVYIPNMSKPKGCWDCFNWDCDHWAEHGYDNSTDCPLIEVNDIQYKAFLEFNEKLMKKLEEHFLYGERRADE